MAGLKERTEDDDVEDQDDKPDNSTAGTVAQSVVDVGRVNNGSSEGKGEQELPDEAREEGVLHHLAVRFVSTV